MIFYILSDVKNLNTPTKKKQSVSDNLLKFNIANLKENEKSEISSMIQSFNDISILNLNEKYLKEASLNYNRQWYNGLDESYISIYSTLNKYYNLFDALEK